MNKKEKIFIVFIILTTISVNAYAEDETQQLIAEAETGNPANVLMNFVLSNYFIWFWVLVVITVIFVPIGAVFGIPTMYRWIDRTFIKPKQGFVVVRQFLPNDQVMEFYGKPTGSLLKLKDWDGNKIEVPVKLGKGWSKYSGSLPVIEIDENCRQRPVESSMVSPINQEEVTKGWKASYETGKLMGSLDFLNELRKYIIIMLVITAIGAGISAYFGYQNMQAVNPSQLQNVVHNAMINTTASEGSDYKTVES